jgi:flagellar hook protein FlgE
MERIACFRASLGMRILAVVVWSWVCASQAQLITQLIVTNGLGFTGRPTDMAIDGAGWFVVRDPATDTRYATRTGFFYLFEDGFLVSPYDGGLRLQGYKDASLTNVGDVQITFSGIEETPNSIKPCKIEADGKIWVTLADGRQVVGGQVLLQQYGASQGLVRTAYKLYRITPSAQPSPMAVPGTAGLGQLISECAEVLPEPVQLTLEPIANHAGPLAKGVLTPTWIPTDLGIQGDGFFLVRNTNTSEVFATRAGLFLVDGDGYLITCDRLRVQGFTDAYLTTPGDVRIDTAGRPAGGDPRALVRGFWINADGKVWVDPTDGTEFIRSQVLLFAFNHPERLSLTNHGLYAGVAQAEPRALTLTGSIYEDGIRQGYLELVNVTEDLLTIRSTLGFVGDGRIKWTDCPTDLAVFGRGFFVLSNPTNGITGVTRQGGFHMDPTGYLVNADGWRVQGFSDGSLAVRGDIRVDGAGRPETADPSASVKDLQFGFDGTVIVEFSDGAQFVRGQVLLQDFKESFLLSPASNGVYTNLAPAGPLPLPLPPASANLGWMHSRIRELPCKQLTLPSREGVRVRVTGEPDTRWRVQASTNLTDWTTFGDSTHTDDEMEFSDPQSSQFPQRFYRVLVSPLGSSPP